MTDPKAALPQSLNTEPDTSTLGTGLSSLSVTDDSVATSSSSPDIEYQVFILAGFGHNLYPLTEEDNLPKALLPIANTPLLYFPLEWCSKAGFRDITVICHTEALERISAYIASLSFEITIHVEAPSSVEDNLGSADVLGLLGDPIKHDFIVLSCDSFTTLPATELLSFHAAQNTSATAVLFDASKNTELAHLKLKENDNSLYVGYEKESHRLLFLKSAIDVHESLELRTSLLWRYPRMNLTTNFQDAHIYIFKRWVIELIGRNNRISSLRTDLLPVLAKMQWQSRLRHREGIPELLPQETTSTTAPPNDSNPMPINLRTSSPVKVSLYIPSHTNHYTLRANSLPTYLILNQHLAALHPGPHKHPSSHAGAKTSIGNDALVAENCTLGERVQIRKSVVGTNVNVGSKTNVKGSVIMEGVVLGEMVKVEDCVVCKGAKVGDKVSLTDCFVGAGYVVESGTKASKQNLVELEDLDDVEDADEEEEGED